MFELSISLTGLVYQTEIRDILSHSMSRALKVYPRDPVAMQAVDTLQSQVIFFCCLSDRNPSQTLVTSSLTLSLLCSLQLSCCGVQSSADWQYILQNSSDVITYPNSCCGAPVLRQGHYECARVWPNGCLDKLDNLMRSSGRAMLLTALAVAVIQVGHPWVLFWAVLLRF
jgi:Tetraspanin family.